MSVLVDWYQGMFAWIGITDPDDAPVDMETLPASCFPSRHGSRDALIVDLAVEGIRRGMSPAGASKLYCVDLTDAETTAGLAARGSSRIAAE
jgi:hypothetical protein